MARFTFRSTPVRPVRPVCAGSYGDDVPGTTRWGKARVTGECPVCHKRFAFVTLHALPNRPRGLARHDEPDPTGFNNRHED